MWCFIAVQPKHPRAARCGGRGQKGAKQRVVNLQKIALLHRNFAANSRRRQHGVGKLVHSIHQRTVRPRDDQRPKHLQSHGDSP